MSGFTIPVSVGDPYQQFQVALDGQVVDITLKWNVTASTWYMDLKGMTFDGQVRGVAVVGGCNLLAPYAITEIGGMYMIDLTGANTDPDFDNFGGRFALMYAGL